MGYQGLPRWLGSKESACNAGDLQETGVRSLGSGRSPGVGHGHPHSCLENPTDGGTRRSAVYGVAEEQDATEPLRSTNKKGGEKGVCSACAETYHLQCPLPSSEGWLAAHPHPRPLPSAPLDKQAHICPHAIQLCPMRGSRMPGLHHSQSAGVRGPRRQGVTDPCWGPMEGTTGTGGHS